MSISERVPGKVYRFRCMHKGNSYDKTYYGTKRQAEKAHEKWLQDVKNGVIKQEESDEDKTFPKIYELYKVARNLEAGSILTYNETVNRLPEQFWNSDIRNISSIKATEAITRIKTNYTEICANEAQKFLKALYNFCINDLKITKENPFDFKTTKAKPKINKEDELIDLESINKLLTSINSIGSRKYRVMVLLSIGCGLRLSELIGLKKEDIDTKAHTLNIYKQYKKIVGKDGNIIKGIGITKSRSSKRKNQIPAFVRKELYPYMESIPDGWLFPGEKPDKPVSDGTVRYQLRNLCKEIGIKKLTPHDLRRIHTTVSLYAGNNVMTITNTLGHANANMTIQYMRKLQSIDNMAAEKMDDFIENEQKKQENE